MFEHHKKESPIISLLGMGGGIGSYVFTAADTGYEIARSLRFDSSSSAYLNRTPSLGNRRTWTWSGWVKKSKLKGVGGDYSTLFAAGSNNFVARFNTSEALEIYDYSGSYIFNYVTTAVYRDLSAWFHVVLAVDTTNATEGDRVKLYINGNRVTAFSTATNPSPNADGTVNTAVSHYIGRASNGIYYDGYLADVWFIDGSALEPSSFGTFDDYGVWQPKRYTGSKSGNSFHLPFSDNSSASALGTDDSGNGNNWTVNNISVWNGGAYQYSKMLSTASPSILENASRAFDGSTTTNASGSGADPVIFTPVPAISYTSSVRVFVYATGGYISLNGGTQIYPSTQDWYTLATGSGTINTIEVQRGGGPGIFAYEVDGTILIDKTSPNNDSLRDSPYNGDTANDTGLGGEIPGNYATLNPLDMGANITLSNGNLDITATAGNLGARSTFALTTQKWYYEITINGISSGHLMALTSPSAPVTDQYPGSTSTNGWSWRNEGTIYKTSSNITVNGSWPSTTYTTGDVLMLAVDVDAGKVWLGKNGTWSNSGSPGTGANASITYTNPLLDGPLVPVVRANSTSVSCNFGQRAFAYSAPSGFKALCTANLDTPLIEDPSTVMDVALYTGNAPSTQTITGLGFSPDMVWIKNRSVTGNHVINDIVRGAGKRLITNLTSSESTDTDRFSAFTSDGFTVGDSTDTNGSSNAIVAWAWDAGTSNATNTSGSITSTVRANISAGFSVVTYNAGPLPAATGATVGHGLGIAPQFIVVKDRTNGNPWGIYHTSLGPGKGLLFSAAAEQVASTWWNNTAPTSSVFSINSDIYATAQPNDDYVAYCFAPVAGYSAFGSYTGNGSTDGPFVYTGFRPAFVLLKCSSASGTYWTIHDNKRLGYNPDQDLLFPNTSDSENSTSYMDFLSNGFKLRIISSFANASGATFIWAAFAESPFAYARAR